jgi:hypothetical protein
MIEGHAGYQGVFLVSQINLPVFTNPGKSIVYPDAETAIFSLDMVFLADMRKIEVTDIIMLIETDKELAVSNWYVSWHLCILPEKR